MTFKEQWLLDHPGVSFNPTVRCPSFYGYEECGSNCANPENVSDVLRVCGECWNREMPEVKNKDLPHILDSGERRQFETGAVRDIQEGKGRCDLMPLEVVAKCLALHTNRAAASPIFEIVAFLNDGNTDHLYASMHIFCNNVNGWHLSDAHMFIEVAKHFEEGAKKYGENNWQKGLPVHCYIDSAVRHYLKWLRGDKDEPHDRAFVWNIMCCIWECDFSPRAKMKGTPVAEELPDPEANSGRFYICNRTPCETCHSDCQCTEYRGEAAVLELCDRDVRYDECPVGLFMTDADGVFLKTEIVNAETGLNTAVHIGLGLSRKFEADTMVTPIKYPFKERERE